MLPLLKFFADNQEHHIRDAIDAMAKQASLTAEERDAFMQSGQRLFDNRVHWARLYLKKAGLIDNTRRAYLKITDRGVKALSQNPSVIDQEFLLTFPEFKAFVEGESNAEVKPSTTPTIDVTVTPDELLDAGYKNINYALAQNLLERLKSCSPSFFEKIVLDVLFAMGYGGADRERLRNTGGTGDGGIDGTIFEDKLGLDVIYVQAKRWENTVGRPDLQKVAGALQGQRAKKGIFVTTSQFSSEAKSYADSVDTRIVLIDGTRLTELMIENGVAVSIYNTYILKRIDSDYFEETE